MTIHRFSEREIARTSEAFGNIRHAFSTYEAVAIPRTATRPTASTAMGRLSLDYAFALTGFLAACSHATGASNAASHSGNPSYDAARPVILARGEGEHRLMQGRRPVYILVDSVTAGSSTIVAGLFRHGAGRLNTGPQASRRGRDSVRPPRNRRRRLGGEDTPGQFRCRGVRSSRHMGRRPSRWHRHRHRSLRVQCAWL